MAEKKMTRKSSRLTLKSKDLPATAGMLHEARHELKSEMTSFRLEMDARFSQIDGRFSQVDARFSQVDARFDQVDIRFNQVESSIAGLRSELKSDIEKVLAAVHRVSLLVEEQNARNKYVLDGYGLLSERMDKIEKKFESDL
jgi:uncharacterized phage infection (PIP) family protein YhgE